MPPITAENDAYGAELRAFLDGECELEVVERDDGYIEAHAGVPRYFATYSEWSRIEREAVRLARGRVLDVGCGGGRVCLFLQEQGHRPIGVDTSPGAVRVCRERGVRDARCLPFTRIDRSLAPLDAVVLFGNNFGLFGPDGRARWLLRRLRNICTPGARIIGQTSHPYATDRPEHLAYHEANRRAGRPGGCLRIRIRFRKMRTPWFVYRLFSPDEIEATVRGTGWKVERLIGNPEGSYFVVLCRE